MPPISSRVVVHKPKFEFLTREDDIIQMRSIKIEDWAKNGTFPDLSQLSNEHFYTYGQLIYILSAKLKKQNINDPEIKLGDADLLAVKHILAQLEKSAQHFQENDADLIYAFFELNSTNILDCLKTFPKFSQKISCWKLTELALKSSEIAEYILKNAELSKIISQDNYARHKIYDAYPSNFFLAEQAVGIFDIERIYRHDNDNQLQDKRIIPANFQLINQKHQEKIKLLNKEKAFKNERENWKRLLKIKDKNDDRYVSAKTALNIQENTSEQTISPTYIRGQIKQLEKKIKKNETELNAKRQEIIALSWQKDFDIGKRALDIFLRTQNNAHEIQQSYENMINLFKMRGAKYRTLIDQRHIEAMFALIKTDKEFVFLFLYLLKDQNVKQEFISFLKNVANNDNANLTDLIQIQAKTNFSNRANALINYETENGYKMFAGYPDVMQAMFKKSPKKFAECLVKSNQACIDINDPFILNLLRKNAAWITAEHLFEINQKIDHNNNKARETWKQCLRHDKGLEKLRAWVDIQITSGDTNTLRYLQQQFEHYPDLRGWLTLGNIKQSNGTIKKDLAYSWVHRSEYDLDICRLVASDKHLFESYQQGLIQNAAPAQNISQQLPQFGKIYLDARIKFEAEFKAKVAAKYGPTTLIDSIKSLMRTRINFFNTYEEMIFADDKKIKIDSDFTQERAYILTLHHWENVKPLTQADEKFFIELSPFFEAKIKKLSLINVILQTDTIDEGVNSDKRKQCILWMNKSPLLLAEVVCSTENDIEKIIELIKFIDEYQPDSIRDPNDNSVIAKDYIQEKDTIVKELNKIVIDELVKQDSVNSKTLKEYAKNILLEANLLQLLELGQRYKNKDELKDLKIAADKAALKKLSVFNAAEYSQVDATKLKSQQMVTYITSILPSASLSNLIGLKGNYLNFLDSNEDFERSIIHQIINHLMDGTEVVPEEVDNSSALQSPGSIGSGSTTTETTKTKSVTAAPASSSVVSDAPGAKKSTNQGKKLRGRTKIREIDSDDSAEVDTSKKTSKKENENHKSQTVNEIYAKKPAANHNSELKAAIESDILKKCTLEQLKVIYIKQPALREKTKDKFIEKFTHADTTAEIVTQFILSIKDTEQKELIKIFAEDDNEKLAEKILTLFSDVDLNKYFNTPEEVKVPLKHSIELFQKFFTHNTALVDRLFILLNKEKYQKNIYQYQIIVNALAEVLDGKNKVNKNLLSNITESNLALYNPYVIILLNNDYEKYIEIYDTNFTNIIKQDNIQKYVDHLSSNLLFKVLNDIRYNYKFVDELYKRNDDVKTKILEKILTSSQVTLESLEILYKKKNDKINYPEDIQKARKLEMVNIIFNINETSENKNTLYKILSTLLNNFNYLDVKSQLFSSQPNESQRIIMVIKILNAGEWGSSENRLFFRDPDIKHSLESIFGHVDYLKLIDKKVREQISQNKDVRKTFDYVNMEEDSAIKKMFPEFTAPLTDPLTPFTSPQNSMKGENEKLTMDNTNEDRKTVKKKLDFYDEPQNVNVPSNAGSDPTSSSSTSSSTSTTILHKLNSITNDNSSSNNDVNTKSVTPKVRQRSSSDSDKKKVSNTALNFQSPIRSKSPQKKDSNQQNQQNQQQQQSQETNKTFS